MSDLTERGKQIRRDTIELALANGGYHWGGSFSCVEILIALFDHVMNDLDMFILSKGHSCWPYYVLLKEKGYYPKLTGHPSRGEGVPFTTGSLGHGLPLALGVALAKKFKADYGRVFVLVGDGEIQEGTFWESLLIGYEYGLDNLICIIDYNGIQGSGFLNFCMDLDNTFHGWGFYDVNGHDVNDLNKVLNNKPNIACPILIKANTVKGKGVSFMENKPEWHSKWLTDDLKQKALSELS